MVISHKHKYLFVELPHTASAAIHKELCLNYDGQSIIRKHTTYSDFLRIATPEEKKYFVFSCIRDPMDMVVSIYYWRKTNHNEVFTNKERWREQGGFVTKQMRREFEFVQETNASFAEYFLKFYRVPYDNWSSLNHHKFDYIIRFENLQEDFGEALKRIGITPVRPLPPRNRTGGRARDFRAEYTPEIREHASFVFGPYMKRWGYSFPESWGKEQVPISSQAMFNFLGFVRNVYWKYIKYARFYRIVLRRPKRHGWA